MYKHKSNIYLSMACSLIHVFRFTLTLSPLFLLDWKPNHPIFGLFQSSSFLSIHTFFHLWSNLWPTSSKFNSCTSKLSWLLRCYWYLLHWILILRKHLSSSKIEKKNHLAFRYQICLFSIRTLDLYYNTFHFLLYPTQSIFLILSFVWSYPFRLLF